MAEIVLRIRLIGGEHLDVSYDEPGATPDDALENVIAILAQLTARCAAGTAAGSRALQPGYRHPGGGPARAVL